MIKLFTDINNTNWGQLIYNISLWFTKLGQVLYDFMTTPISQWLLDFPIIGDILNGMFNLDFFGVKPFWFIEKLYTFLLGTPILSEKFFVEIFILFIIIKILFFLFP